MRKLRLMRRRAAGLDKYYFLRYNSIQSLKRQKYDGSEDVVITILRNPNE